MLESMKTSEALPDSWWKPPTAHKIRDNQVMNLDMHGTAVKSSGFKKYSGSSTDDLSEDDLKYLDEILDKSVPIYEELIKLGK